MTAAAANLSEDGKTTPACGSGTTTLATRRSSASTPPAPPPRSPRTVAARVRTQGRAATPARSTPPAAVLRPVLDVPAAHGGHDPQRLGRLLPLPAAPYQRPRPDGEVARPPERRLRVAGQLLPG